MSEQNRLRYILYFLLAVILVVIIPQLSQSLQVMLTKVLIFAIFAMSLDLLYGYTALFSLGHAAYFGTAAYAVALLMRYAGINNVWITVPTAILAGTLLAAIFGLIAVRFIDTYFLLVTFALGMLMYVSYHQIRWLKTPGLEGITGIPKPDFVFLNIKWDITNFYFLVLVTFIIVFYLLYRIVNSPFGNTLKGIRESEQRMKVLGYNTWLYKYLAFIIAGLFASIGGILYAWDKAFVAAVTAGSDYSIMAMVMVIIGGAGTLWGAIIGSTILVLAQHYVSLVIPARWPLIQGIIFLITVLFFRGGFAPHLEKLYKGVNAKWRF